MLCPQSNLLHWYSEGWCPLARTRSCVPCLLTLCSCPLLSIQPWVIQYTTLFTADGSVCYIEFKVQHSIWFKIGTMLRKSIIPLCQVWQSQYQDHRLVDYSLLLTGYRLRILFHAQIESLALEWLSVPRGLGFALEGDSAPRVVCQHGQSEQLLLSWNLGYLLGRMWTVWNVRKVITKRVIITGSQTFQNTLMLMEKRAITITVSEVIWCQMVREI